MTLIMGIPNAGKTTYADEHYEHVLHLDKCAPPPQAARIKKCNKFAARSPHNDICVEGVYVTKAQRKELLEAVKDKSPKICIWLNTPIDICKAREKRGRGPHLFDNYLRRLEPPTLDEGWDEIREVTP